MGVDTFAYAGSGGAKGRFGFLLVALTAAAATLALCAPSAFALSPSVGSKAASNVAETTVTLNGTVNPNGLATTTYFEYGPTAAYGSKTAEVSVGSGSSALETAKGITGLTPHTTYHYRVVAKNADGTSSGGDRTVHVGWKALSIPVSSGENDISCSSPTECTMVVNGSAYRWNGTEWKSQTVPAPAGGSGVALRAVSCVSSTSCTAVGSYVDSSSKTVTLVEAWNGSEWKVQPSPIPTSSWAQLEDVDCTSATECTAVGRFQKTGGPPFVMQTLAMRWDGSEWKLQTTPSPSANEIWLKSVSCPTSSFCMAVGFYNDPTLGYTPFSIRWTGAEWLLKDGTRPTGTTGSWFKGVSCASANSCIAVGTKEVDPGTHENQTMAQWWTGIAWSNQIATPNPGTDRSVEDVDCVSAGACTAVGHYLTGSGYMPFRFETSGSSAAHDLPMPAGGYKGMLFGVSCIASRGCMTAGNYWTFSEGPLASSAANWRSAQPSVTTAAATGIGQTTATIHGTVNPNGSETKAFFEYGKNLSELKTAEVNLGSGSSATETNAALTGLSPGTTYFYRVVANNEHPQTSRGSTLTLRTMGPPTVVTSAAEVSKSGQAATLRGEVNPNGLSTTYQFEYGTSPGVYTTTVPAVAESAGSGTETKTVSYNVSGLTPGQTYYYRITATNSLGKSNGSGVSFVTPSPVTLKVGGTALKTGASLKVFSSNLTFVSNTSAKHSCAEAELSGQVAENPGAVESVTAPKMQNAGGAKCLYSGITTVQYSFPSAMTLEYVKQGIEPVARTGKFNLVGDLYWGTGKIAECEWQVELSGKYNYFKSLELQLSGSAILVKGPTGFCFTSETLSGTFAVTSGGSPVEATP